MTTEKIVIQILKDMSGFVFDVTEMAITEPGRDAVKRMETLMPISPPVIFKTSDIYVIEMVVIALKPKVLFELKYKVTKIR